MGTTEPYNTLKGFSGHGWVQDMKYLSCFSLFNYSSRDTSPITLLSDTLELKLGFYESAIINL